MQYIQRPRTSERPGSRAPTSYYKNHTSFAFFYFFIYIGPVASLLQDFKVDLITNEACQSAYGSDATIRSTHICTTGTRAGTGVCNVS